jgi:hypothetical protein
MEITNSGESMLLSQQEKQVAEARLWIGECRWQDEPETLVELTDAEVMSGIDRYYQGGWNEFCRDFVT